MKKNSSIPFIFQFIEDRPKGSQRNIEQFFDNTIMGLNIRDHFYPWDYANHLTDLD
jgi:hypothetical protein